jgi:hypothetical protein
VALIKLGEPNSANYFYFKIGDRVRVKLSNITGLVVSGDFHPGLGSGQIFYLIKTPFGKTCTFRQDDLELLPPKNAP